MIWRFLNILKMLSFRGTLLAEESLFFVDSNDSEIPRRAWNDTRFQGSRHCPFFRDL